MSPIVGRLFMQISFLDLSSSKFIFIQATKCVVQRDSWLKKSGNCFFFLAKNRIQRRNLVYPWSMFGPQGGVYRDLFTFKVFKECLLHFHSTQFSLLHHAYKRFSILLSYFDEKTEIVSFFGQNLWMSDPYTMLYHWRHSNMYISFWQRHCTEHIKFYINQWFKCISTFTGPISNGFSLVNHLYRKVN